MKLFDVYPINNIAIEKAKGSYVWDDKGEQYLDLYGGHAVISIGHTHPHYVERITNQLNKVGFYSNSVKIPLQEELAEKLGKISRELQTTAGSDLSLEIYLILKFRADEMTLDEVDGLIERLKLALESNPGYADIQNDLGVLYAAKCKMYIDRSHEAFRQALTVNPGFKKAEKNLKLSGNDRQGIHFLLKALLD